jgi:hypothetical protein
VNDPLQLIWPLMEFRHAIVTDSIVTGWPTGFRQRLVDLEFMISAEHASRVLCPECGEHEEEVIAADGPDDDPRFFIPCPEILRAHVPPDALRQWEVHSGGIACALAATLGLTGRRTELVADRLWRLGRTDWHGKSRDVLFARGLHWDDAATVRAEIVRGRKPIVFVPSRLPPDGFWLRRVPPVIVLSQYAALCEDQIEVEALAIATAIHDADAAGSSDGLITVTEQQLKLMIRQQIKAETKTELTDDILIAAYRHHGAYRSAAEYLSQETEQTVSKDAVYRAVQRAGGVLAILNSEDSNSVVRGVASQRRDKKGKTLLQSKPIEGE